MFEYLMPALVMRSFPFTVLDQTYAGRACARQIAYGGERGVPWGMSESAYNLRDRHQTYQYRAFGVPDLALKRGLGRDLVVAPYASALAAMVDPQRALANLARAGGAGRARAATASATRSTTPGPIPATRVRRGRHLHGAPHRHEPGRAHQRAARRRSGSGASTPTRWCARPSCCCTSAIPRRLVLQEPQATRGRRGAARAGARAARGARGRRRPTRPQPHVALLGHLPYTIMVSHCGGGLQPLRGAGRHPLARRRDARRHRPVLLREGPARPGGSGRAAHQPVCAPADWYRAYLATDRVTFHRADGDDRDPHRDRRRAGGRGRGAAGDGHQPRRRRRARSS